MSILLHTIAPGLVAVQIGTSFEAAKGDWGILICCRTT